MFEKSAYADRLSSNSRPRWLGQNTNLLPLPPQMLQAAMTERARLVYLVTPNDFLGICYAAHESEAVAAFVAHRDVIEMLASAPPNWYRHRENNQTTYC